MAENEKLTDEQINEAWSALGYQPQAFPYYYNSNGNTFQNGAIAGEEFTVNFSLDNFPHMLLGLRITNEWQPIDDEEDPATADEIALQNFVKQWVDDQQTVRLALTQQSIISKSIPQRIIQGANGEVWHNFPTPFPMAGGNTVDVTVRRLTSYPFLRDQRIVPTVYVSLVVIMLRADRLTMRTIRRGAP